MTTKELADHASHAARRPTLVEAQAAVRTFLQEALPDVHRVDITKVMPIEFNERGMGSGCRGLAAQRHHCRPWDCPRERPVLDQNFYVVRLDGAVERDRL